MFNLNLENLNPAFCYSSSNEIVSSGDFLKAVGGASLYLENKGPRLALCVDDSYVFAVVMFAALALKKEVILLPNGKEGTLRLHQNEFDDIFCDEDFFKIQTLTPSKPFHISPDAPITFFTSGASGQPQKIKKTFRNLYSEVLVLEKTFFHAVGGTVILATVSHQHIYGFLFRLLWPICQKRTWISTTAEYPEQVSKWAQELDSLVLVSSPAFLKRFYLPGLEMSNCRSVFSSGGPLEFKDAQATFQNFKVYAYEVYGSTETGGIAYRQQKSNDQSWTTFESVFVSTDSEAVLTVKSPYFDGPSMKVGDRAEVTNSGFRLLGRVGDVVKIEEKRISLSQLNLKIQESPLIRESVVMALDFRGRQQTACLAVLSQAGDQMLKSQGFRAIAQDLKGHLQTQFDSIVIPKRFRFVSQLPYNRQGKLIKSDLESFFNDR